MFDEEVVGEVTVVDVYDIASEIGKECEKIIDKYGAETVTALMPKVIAALEHLEYLASKNERENAELDELHFKIKQLEAEKLERAEYRKKFERDLEAIEDQWRTETKDLIAAVTRLQDENRKLAKSTTSVPSETSDFVTPSSEDHRLILRELRAELRAKEDVVRERSVDAERLRSQVERAEASARELRRRHKQLRAQVRGLCEERADFLVRLQDQRRDVQALRRRLGLAQKENEDLARVESAPSYPGNVVVYEVDDPNRPCFTTAELKDILHERNELKARVSDLEDELNGYRPRADDGDRTESNNDQSENKEISVENELENANVIDNNEPDEDEEAPVQGPLPYEPDDAPWKRANAKESGIRKFFRKLFSDGNSSGTGNSFPRRSLSTLSKMALSAVPDPVNL